VREPLINNSGHATLNAVYMDKNATLAAGGALNTTYFKLGQDTNATLSVSGGALSAANHLDVGGYGGVATMNISSGSVAVGGLYLNLNADTNPVAGSMLNLTGGTLTASGTLSINESHATLLNMAGGTLVLPSSQLTGARIWMNDGSIAAYGVAGNTNSFNIDQTSLPGSLVITAIYSGFVADTFTQWNPQVFTNLPPSLDQSMALVPPGVHVLTNANYCFGTAVATNGEVYFTEWEHQTIRKYNPVSRALTTVVSSRPEIFGIAADNAGNLFYSQDSEASSPHGTVIRRTSGGSEQTIMTNLTRPRQIATDTAGNLYVVLEAGKILKWTKSTGITTTLVDQDQMARTPEGIAVAPDGRIYFSTYGHGAGPGTALTAGAVWVRETSGVIRPIAAGFARGRGLALHPNGDLYLAAEANVWDNGNSGILVRIATNGVVTRVVTGIDYPQFPSIGADGKVYVSIARDDKLICYDPQNSFSPQTVLTPGVTLIAEGATWQQTAGANYPIQLHLTNTNNPADTMTISGFLQANQGTGKIGMWFNVPVTNLHISLVPIPDPNSGNTNTGDFVLPASSVACAYGPAESFVIPLREHKRCRWPMTGLGTAQESPGPGFGETPVSYLVYVSVDIRPPIKIQPWTGNQMRISWPTWAIGYALQRSTSVTGGYSNPGLTVTTEGSENAAYDTVGTGARFYRLIK
jgi:sugar lactone lactonase YvrE